MSAILLMENLELIIQVLAEELVMGLTYDITSAGSAALYRGWSTVTTYSTTINTYYGFTLNYHRFVVNLYNGFIPVVMLIIRLLVLRIVLMECTNYISLANVALTKFSWHSIYVNLPVACENISNLKIKIIGYYSNNN
ncbi:MAG: hypothetical protein R2765_07975 [Ferruginibacter sp.]